MILKPTSSCFFLSKGIKTLSLIGTYLHLPQIAILVSFLNKKRTKPLKQTDIIIGTRKIDTINQYFIILEPTSGKEHAPSKQEYLGWLDYF